MHMYSKKHMHMHTRVHTKISQALLDGVKSMSHSNTRTTGRTESCSLFDCQLDFAYNTSIMQVRGLMYVYVCVCVCVCVCMCVSLHSTTLHHHHHYHSVHRTLPQYAVPHRERNRWIMQNILNAYARYDPETGYCQVYLPPLLSHTNAYDLPTLTTNAYDQRCRGRNTHPRTHKHTHAQTHTHCCFVWRS